MTSPLLRCALLLTCCAAWTACGAARARAEDRDLIGHWPLVKDLQDHGPNQLPGVATALKAGGPQDGAAFDGVSSRIDVKHHEALSLKSSEFSIALWAHTSEELDDLLGDLVSKYDPQRRCGFQFGLQNHPGVTSSQSNDRNLHFGIDQGRQSEWTDHGRLGNAVLIFGLAVHQGQLFAGTCEAGESEAGRVFRFDGQTWTDCGAPDRCNSVSSLAVHQGRLYVGVSKYRLAGSSLAESDNPHLGGKVYRYDGDDQWTLCGTLPGVEAINGLVVYRGRLYAGSLYAPAAFFRYEGGDRWTSCGVPDGKRVESLTVFNGHLYATGYDEGAVYRYDGESWEDLGVIDGAHQTYGFAAYRGELYVSEWPNARVFRWDGRKSWLPAGRLGEEKESMPLMVYNGKMYGGTLPLAEVYRYDEPDWTRMQRLDWTPDVRYRRAWSMAVYRGRLFVGTLPSGRVHSVEFGRNVTFDEPLPAGWAHLAAVRGADRLRLYVNGKQVAMSAPLDAAPYDLTNTAPLQIGFGAHDHWNGKLRDVRIYGRALAPREIAELAKPAE